MFADGGGHTALASDALEQADLSVDLFNDEPRRRIDDLVPNSRGAAQALDMFGRLRGARLFHGYRG